MYIKIFQYIERLKINAGAKNQFNTIDSSLKTKWKKVGFLKISRTQEKVQLYSYSYIKYKNSQKVHYIDKT